MLSATNAGVSDLGYAGKDNCCIAVPARLAAQLLDWNGAYKEDYESGPGALKWRHDGKDTEYYEGNLLRGVAWQMRRRSAERRR